MDGIRPEISEENFDLWIKPVDPVKIENHLLYLQVPNKFFTEWLKENLQKKIEALVKQFSGQEVYLHYLVQKDIDKIIKKSEQIDPIAETLPQNEFTLSELNPRYTFTNFVVGPSNRFAHATAEAIVKNPGRQFNPLVIYGGVGLGKTHLMHALGHALRKENPKHRVLYATSEHFINEYIESIRHNRPDFFRNKYRSLDCLLLDDAQFLMGKGRSEEEFFYTFNSLFESRKQIVITSDRAPKEMSPSERRLVSRLEWGVVADIKPPDLETRIAILRKKSEAETLHFPDDVILYIASHIKTSIRELEGALIRVGAFSSLTGSSLSVDMAKDVLKDTIASTEDSVKVHLDTILKVVSRKYNLEVRDLKSKQRSDTIAFARQMAMYLACSLTDHSTPEIGNVFGGKDHTTVLYARNKIQKLLETDMLMVQQINDLSQEIKSLEIQ